MFAIAISHGNRGPQAPSEAIQAGTGVAYLMLPDARALSRIYRRFAVRRTYHDDLTLLVNWATLLEAGVPLAASLRRLARASRHRPSAVGMTMLADGVERGYRLSAMIGIYPQLFPPWWEGFIALGEQTGDLPRVLRLLHRYVQERLVLRRKFLTAFVGPAINAAVAVLAIGVFLFAFLPRLFDYLTAIGVIIPAPVAWYLMHERAIWHGIMGLFVAVVLGTLITFRYYQSSWGRQRLDQFRLDAPIFGRLVRKYELLRLVHGIKVLVGEGTSFPMGLESLARSSNNLVIQRSLEEAARQLDQGVPLEQALATIPVMLPETVQIITTGWLGGCLEEMLERYFRHLIDQISEEAKVTVLIITNVTLVVIATLVVGIVLAFYLTFFWAFLTASANVGS